jgi:hypothetical protein
VRYKDTPDLFGKGVGTSTTGTVHCGLCGATWNADNEDENGNIIDEGADSVRDTQFAGITVCDCCFERIEDEILRRMPNILKWFAEITAERRRLLLRDEALLKKVGE